MSFSISTNRWTKTIRNLILSLVLVSVQLMPFVAFAPRAGADQGGGNTKVTICHRTNSATNPYTVIEVDENAVDGESGNSGQVPDHYGEHVGPLASSEAVANQLKEDKIEWGDIIPPVSPHHNGLNWTTEGQAIYNNNCEYVEEPETGFIKVYKEVDNGYGFEEDSPSQYGFVWGYGEEIPARDFGTSVELEKDGGPYKITENLVNGYEYVGWYDGDDSCEDPDGTDFPVVAIRTDKTRHVTLCNKKVEVPEVDFCDPADRPAGMSIAEWFEKNDFDGSKCFELEPVVACGSFDIKFNDLTGLGFEVRYVEDDKTPELANWEGDGVLPASFPEDYNGGSVEITYYIVGPESDYLKGTSLPNIWDSNGQTVTVDTDCEEPVDFCDPADRPAGMSIAEWFEKNQVDGSDCFELKPIEKCGSFDFSFNNKTPLDYEVRYVIGDKTPDVADWKGEGVLPAVFLEDYNGGSVEITYYVVGEESDYFKGFGLPNIWDGNGKTVTVDTDCEEPEPSVKIVATKIVCEDEKFLPNWGAGGPNITSTTASDWVNQNQGCVLTPGWDFQYAFNNQANPGDNEKDGGTGWTSFGPTDNNGQTSVEIDNLDDVNRIWVREMLKNGYIGFTFNENNQTNKDNVSAELYCHKDVLNYDNYDFINNLAYGKTYYCVAWNVEVKKPTVKIKKEIVGENLTEEDFATEFGFSTYINNQLIANDKITDGGKIIKSNLEEGEFSVVENTPSGWALKESYCVSEDEEQLNPASFEVKNGNTYYCYFTNEKMNGNGETKNGRIFGYKLNDINSNTEEDEGEQRLAGWTINLYEACSNEEIVYVNGLRIVAEDCVDGYRFVDSTETGIGGNYSFEDLKPGDYKVCEVMQDGWQSTYPGGSQCVKVDDVRYDKICIANFYNVKQPDEPEEPETPGQVLGDSTTPPVTLATTGQELYVNFIVALMLVGSVAGLHRVTVKETL